MTDPSLEEEDAEEEAHAVELGIAQRDSMRRATMTRLHAVARSASAATGMIRREIRFAKRRN
ncbi:MAG: hypothetical protein ACLSAF_09295 [Intestinimonas sp.]